MAEQVAVTCKYPGCEMPSAPASGPGRPPEYCVDLSHNRVSAWRERRRVADQERGTVRSDADTEQPVTMARVSGAEMLREMRVQADKLAGIAGRLTEAAATMADPTAVEVELEVTRTAADQRAAAAEAARAQAEQRVSMADQLRVAADEAADEMATHLSDARARLSEAQQRLAQAIADHAAQLEEVRAEAQSEVDAMAEERDAAVAQAEADKVAAEARVARAGQEAAVAIEQAAAEAGARVEAATSERDRARAEAVQHEEAARQAEQRAAAADARAEVVRGDAVRAHEEAAQMLGRVRADADRERGDLRTAFEARVEALEEARIALRARAERAERDLDRAYADLERLRSA